MATEKIEIELDSSLIVELAQAAGWTGKRADGKDITAKEHIVAETIKNFRRVIFDRRNAAAMLQLEATLVSSMPAPEIAAERPRA